MMIPEKEGHTKEIKRSNKSWHETRISNGNYSEIIRPAGRSSSRSIDNSDADTI
jgi:hypothetical protein